jgi:hypothetical protein
VLRAVAIASVIATSVARAAPCPTDARAQAEALRAHLDREAHRAHTWDLAWGAGFGVVAVGYAVMADRRWEAGITLDDAQVDDLWVGAIKATIAAGSHAILPVRVTRAPAPTADPCADLAAALAARDRTAHAEALAYWMSIAGGVALNGGGFLYVGVHDHAWGTATISAVLGAAVTVAHAWTAPGGAATWRIDAAASPQFTGLVLGRSF